MVNRTMMGWTVTILVVAALVPASWSLVHTPPPQHRRHHRHRRVPVPQDSNFFFDKTSRRLKAEQLQNVHKPEFTRCEEYRPEVEEESQRGREYRKDLI